MVHGYCAPAIFNFTSMLYCYLETLCFSFLYFLNFDHVLLYSFLFLLAVVFIIL